MSFILSIQLWVLHKALTAELRVAKILERELNTRAKKYSHFKVLLILCYFACRWWYGLALGSQPLWSVGIRECWHFIKAKSFVLVSGAKVINSADTIFDYLVLKYIRLPQKICAFFRRFPRMEKTLCDLGDFLLYKALYLEPDKLEK